MSVKAPIPTVIQIKIVLDLHLSPTGTLEGINVGDFMSIVGVKETKGRPSEAPAVKLKMKKSRYRQAC
jgi:hypothetical protein